MRGLHLHAPDAAAVLVQSVVARLGVVHEHAVAGGREQPRHGVVGGVRARVVAPGGNERRDDRAVVLLVGTLGHVVLHLPAALVHAVRALAEAEVALARAGAERDARGRHRRCIRADHLHAQGDNAVGVRGQAHEQAAAVRVVAGERARPGAAPAPGVEHARGVEAPGGRAEAERAGHLGEHGPGAVAGQLDRAGVSAEAGVERAGVHRRRRGRWREEEGHQSSECAGRGQHARHDNPGPADPALVRGASRARSRRAAGCRGRRRSGSRASAARASRPPLPASRR